MTSPLLIDLTHTSHTRARTGVQRVARALERGLRDECTAVTYDPYECAWRPLEPWEEANLDSANPSSGRGARWPVDARVRGEWRRMRRRPDALGPVAAKGSPGGLVMPEIFSAAVSGALPSLFAAAKGPHVAVFHDAVALQFPEFTPRSTVSRFPGYMRDLLQFDGIAAVSETSRAVLLDYWRWLGVARVPEVAAITLGIDSPGAGAPALSVSIPTVLCVSSIEGRKNHIGLLRASEQLWAAGIRFRLRLIGLANPETGAAALRLIEALRASGRPLQYEGASSDEALEAAYRECAFTVYPSLGEGFGLPIAESLSRGKPCLCRMDGATGEIARIGGCLGIGTAEPAQIAAALGELLASPPQLAALEAEAKGRRFKTWVEYVSEFRAWMGTLQGNP